ncbi:MAG: 3-phosphoshikimate 1-carboxyvinyltransferase [Prevotellaceae bacterium]|jgi:3-phosphoshikimate 1-carboxyvinyltransferase|nr:3-phosphoshikimate 1-carboxyvinyltransferase [Prevotellaceae bacterium]
MQYTITAPKRIGRDTPIINLPASKSISNRLIIIRALAGVAKKDLLDEWDFCDDVEVLSKALKAPRNKQVIDIGAAGTAMRFLTAYLSITPGTRILTGSERMRQRPIGTLVDALRKLGAQIEYVEKEGFPPLRITGGELTGNEVKLTGNISSQYISALLMIAPKLRQGLKIHLTGNVLSRPYIEMTVKLMRDFNAQVGWDDDRTITVAPGAYKNIIDYPVEGDWSSASYWYEVVSLIRFEEIILGIQGLHYNPSEGESLQGDSRLVDIFKYLGVHTVRDYHPSVNGFETIRLIKDEDYLLPLFLNEDMSDIPDLVQTLAVTCCLKNVPFRFSGVQSLRIKETDRIEALITELRKLGFVLYIRPDNALIWEGERCKAQRHPVIETYKDHRMAMAFAPACLKFPSVVIEDPMVVTKSYSHFWDCLLHAGFEIKEL